MVYATARRVTYWLFPQRFAGVFHCNGCPRLQHWYLSGITSHRSDVSHTLALQARLTDRHPDAWHPGQPNIAHPGHHCELEPKLKPITTKLALHTRVER